MGPTTTLVHDYLTQRGGAERVVVALTRAFPSATLHTSVHEPSATYPELRDVRVVTSGLQRVPIVRGHPRLALPVLPSVFDRMTLTDSDVVLCSSTGFAHGVPTDRPKVVYCHNPPRWLYQTDDYLKGQAAPVGAGLRLLRRRLLKWDWQAARSADRYLVNSTVVRDRVRAAYGLDATIVPPPVMSDPTAAKAAVPGLEPGFFLAVGRARGYKNIEVTCQAFADLPDQRLVVVGGLPAGQWPSTITGLTDVPEEQLRWLYASCEATIAVAREDFGLTPLEGNAFGRPALCLRAGGYLDTLAEGTSGWFVERLDPVSVQEAVRQHLHEPCSPAGVLAHAANYSQEAFTAAVTTAVLDAVR